MQDGLVGKIEAHPKYAQLKQRRNKLGIVLTVLMLAVYYGYIALIAFDKAFLAKPVGTGVMSVGVPVGMAVIVFTIVITGIYVRRANSEYDQLTQDILKDVAK
ncbi:DUF485 domain-containing protein [Ralstonia sp. 22086]|jgi:uncharacterized membrane protein (DUF485 family)|uniref:DUF485 domain-containing protein n=2 Tax=Ralstonia TaxID=48736 RepID=A0ABT2L4J4_9RALS|nr:MULTISPECIES: DUF485 domain-containing protein [Ralstonia]MCT7295842.1 DUF485 domain-containing protein [Ralstonia mojiangensis]MCT7307494.1 DUF485 domain-containing protein [Ralstonia wenshanensis]MCT7310315.1 DUF485 domain-containing protein [Ralstonia mojiangensis]MDY7509253.1 DUF485 domain-containing protein [Ralstonia wenshanensis]UGS91514.1 DUF485 domain-containing protein [Ralstonia wenshanensis]